MSGAKNASTKHTLRPGVAEDEVELLGREPQVERVDDARAEEAGVVQLEVLVAVEGHHREPVVALDAELAPQAVGQPQHPVDVLAVRGDVGPVEDGLLRGEPLRHRQQVPVVDQLLHGPLLPPPPIPEWAGGADPRRRECPAQAPFVTIRDVLN